MTPQEHYQAAEELLAEVRTRTSRGLGDNSTALAAAQVHATLATYRPEPPRLPREVVAEGFARLQGGAS